MHVYQQPSCWSRINVLNKGNDQNKTNAGVCPCPLLFDVQPSNTSYIRVHTMKTVAMIITTIINVAFKIVVNNSL